MTRYALACLLVLGGLLAPVGTGAMLPPSLVLLLLDTTRADRMSAWGNPRPTTPHLDLLATSGVRFARHFANSHATRPSMPQLMSGRYYQQNILRTFRSEAHPRDWPFAAADPTLVLLPELLERAGYHLAAVSAHPWVDHESRFGAPFDTFELLDATLERGHADASHVVDRGLAAWAARPVDRPTLLYLHFMDQHIPRRFPERGLRFGTADPAVRRRFDAAGEPDFDDRLRDWDRSDARDFTPEDVQYFTDVYDTLLVALDEQIGRLLAAIRSTDPDLRNTVVAVVADHGEELGEHGRISHEASLDDAVQHIPWIVAGAGIDAGQTAWGISENVDVLPTLAGVLGLRLPETAAVDGRELLVDGRLCAACLRRVATYAWENYRARRLGRKLLREELPGSLRGRCTGERRLLGPDRRDEVSDEDATLAASTALDRTLGGLERRFRATRFARPNTEVSVLPAFWRSDAGVDVACRVAGPETPRTAFTAAGWIWTGRGLVVMTGVDETPPLPLVLEVPDGRYEISLGVRPAPAPPRFFGYERWLRRSIRRTTPKEHHELGTGTARGGRLRVEIPAALAHHRHVVQLRLRPLGVELAPAAPAMDPEMRERLRRLGYID